MRFLAVHPGPLMYTKIFLRLEPLGLECVAEAARRAGHQVRIIDLQVESQAAFRRILDTWRPQAIAFGCNYLANVPEVLDLAQEAARRLPGVFVLAGGHSASFVARDMIEQSNGAIACVLKGEGEAGIAALLDAVEAGSTGFATIPGVVSADGEGPQPSFVADLDSCLPARDLLRHRRKYFIGHLDPAASIEFSRGCPWDCAFCSAWTFYGRSYRMVSPERAVEDLASIREPGVFIVDDVAFIKEQHGLAIGEAVLKRGLRKSYYLETRGDVLLKNREVFQLWQRLGLKYLFIGLEAIDADGLSKFRKRIPLGANFEALEFARSLGVQVAVNLIADPDWDRQRFDLVRQWCLEVPEIVNISVNTPYPGTESWLAETRRLTTRDYRLFDIQHAVLPTRLPLDQFYAELVETQRVLHHKHLGWTALRQTAALAAGRLLRGQTNFIRMLWKFNSVFNPQLLLADHSRPPRYAIRLPRPTGHLTERHSLYVHGSDHGTAAQAARSGIRPR